MRFTVAVVSGIATVSEAGAMQMNMMYCPLSLNCGQPSESYHQNGATVGLPDASTHPAVVVKGSAMERVSVPLAVFAVEISSR